MEPCTKTCGLPLLPNFEPHPKSPCGSTHAVRPGQLVHVQLLAQLLGPEDLLHLRVSESPRRSDGAQGFEGLAASTLQKVTSTFWGRGRSNPIAVKYCEVRVPLLFSLVDFSRGNPPNPKRGKKKALLGDLEGMLWMGWSLGVAFPQHFGGLEVVGSVTPPEGQGQGEKSWARNPCG